jgi:hypothetical protein
MMTMWHATNPSPAGAGSRVVLPVGSVERPDHEREDASVRWHR